jgi:hypothetical protein
MSERMAQNVRLWTAPIYLLALLLIVLPAIDLVLSQWPIQPGNPQWRYRIEGGLSTALLTMLLGLLAATALAAARRDRKVLALLLATQVVLVLLLFVAAADFSLNAIEMRSGVALDERKRFLANGALVLIRCFAAAALTAWLAFAGWKSLRGSPVRARVQEASLIRR